MIVLLFVMPLVLLLPDLTWALISRAFFPSPTDVHMRKQKEVEDDGGDMFRVQSSSTNAVTMKSTTLMPRVSITHCETT
jgi:hypothetical protein